MGVFHGNAGDSDVGGRSFPALLTLLLISVFTVFLLGMPRAPLASGPLLRWAEGTCSRPLYFGITPDWPPYQYIDASGAPLGGDVSLMRDVSAELGCRLVVEVMPWSQLLIGMLSGKVDVIGGASWTKERSRRHHYSKPYRQETLGLFVQSSELSDLEISSLESFIGTSLKLGIVSDSYIGGEFEELIDDPEFRKRLVPDPTQDQFDLVVTNKIDAFLTDSGSGLYTVYRRSLDSSVTLYPGYLLDNGPIHYMFGKASVDKSMLGPFNDMLKVVQDRRGSTGTYVSP